MLETIQKRKNFAYILLFLMLLLFILGNILGVKASMILGAGGTPDHFIGSAHAHSTLKGLVAIVFIMFQVASMKYIEWPKIFTETSTVAMSLGTISFSAYLTLMAYGARGLAGSFSTPGTVLFSYGLIAYTICFSVGALFGGEN